MATPYLPNINSYDIDVGTTITYQANNAYTLLYSNKINIYNINDELICSHTYAVNASQGITTAMVASQHVIPDIDDDSWVFATGHTKAEMVNNQQYFMNIITYTSDDVFGTSNKIGFWTLPTPTVDIEIEAQQIPTTSYNVIAKYDTNDAIVNNAPNEVKFYIYYGDYLYAESPVIFTSGIIGEGGQYQLNYTFDNLRNGDTYYIVVMVSSLQGMLTYDGLEKNKKITPQIEIIPINVLSAKNNKCDGSIDIKSSLTNIVGELADGSTYESRKVANGVDLQNPTNTNLIYDEGLTFTANYNLSFWATDITYATNINPQSTQYILHLVNTDDNGGIIDVFMLEDDDSTHEKAVMCVYPTGYDGVVNYFESNEIEMPTNGYTWIGLQYKNYIYDIKIDNVTF